MPISATPIQPPCHAPGPLDRRTNHQEILVISRIAGASSQGVERGYRFLTCYEKPLFDQLMKMLAAALVLAAFTSCEREDPFMGRGPNGFTKEEFQIDLETIPHTAVRHFNGVVLVLDLSEADVDSLKSDGRFPWAKPNYNGQYTLGGELFMDGEKFEIDACQWEEPGAATGWDWKMIAVDSTRGRLFAAVDARPHFAGFGASKPNQRIEQGSGGQPATRPESK